MDNAHMIRILLADDQALMRMGFSMVLNAQPDIEVVGEAQDGHAAVTQARALKPDVILMDVRMPSMDGIEATRQIVEAIPDTRILILTTFDLDEYAFAGLKAGASGFLLKDTRPEELVEAIRTIASGEAVVSPRVTKRMLDMFASRLPEEEENIDTSDGNSEILDGLTPREQEILMLIAQGLSNAEIAEQLYVSATTVKTHVGNVLTKLGVRDRVQAVVYAYESGLIRPHSHGGA
ncbi:response regulator [Actinomyces vulturis]|uniref:response regulator n=1 Tax=Actinomyces vulturis TaxID=1857645 RepID=UPI000835D572|nr:response regulator transcription factor [Actinomyces vulturis]